MYDNPLFFKFVEGMMLGELICCGVMFLVGDFFRLFAIRGDKPTLSISVRIYNTYSYEN
jgi:hypothetical protein